MGYDSIYCKYIKVILDFIMAFCFILLFFWLYIIIAIIIKIDDSKGPIIFKQERIGKNGKVYTMYKFRSMKVGAENTGSGVYSNDKDDRITKVGLFLRKTSLDELPQLFNILKGDNALIGPRSPLTYHPWTWDKYSEEQKLMFKVKPGLTGWTQVHGRRTVKWDKRIELNCWYAQNVSFKIDIKIFFLTFKKLFTHEDNENTEKTA